MSAHLRVQQWPRDDGLEKIAPDLHRTLMSLLPVPNFMSPSGSSNIYSYNHGCLDISKDAQPQLMIVKVNVSR